MIELADVEAAAARLEGVTHRTPVITSRSLDRLLDAQVYCKAENLQRVGAFKLRGAYNAIARLDADDRARGVFAYSSGNHAQAVALAAQLFDIPATLLMPEDAPPVKLAATRGYGADVVTYDRYHQDRDQLGRSLAAERGATLIPPFDHADVMAGQGTVALELLEQAGPLDLLLVPVGGGGLLAGCATVAAALAPGCEVVGVEPAVRTVARRAMATGEVVTEPVPRTIADGQQTTSIGALPLAVLRERVDRIVGVDDAAIRDAMRFLLERCKLVVEPSGASALAAALDGQVQTRGRRVGVVLSGGNVDVGRLHTLLAAQ